MTILRLLVVDDDTDMSEMLVDFIQKQGFAAYAAATQRDIRERMQDGRIDLILLDVMLGDESGICICEQLRREEEVPIILVSALSADHQRMRGYQAGADDYIAKPFNPDLLLARVRAVLRRSHRTPSLSYRRSTGIWSFGGWRYDSKRDEVISPQGYDVALSRRETALLKILLANPRVPLTRDEIGAALDDTGSEDGAIEAHGRAIDMLVGRLRSKIEENPRQPQILRTERGVGYVLSIDVERLNT